MKLVRIQSAIGGHLVLVRIVDQSWSCERATFGPKIRQGSPAGPSILVRIAHQAYGRIIRGPAVDVLRRFNLGGTLATIKRFQQVACAAPQSEERLVFRNMIGELIPHIY